LLDGAVVDAGDTVEEANDDFSTETPLASEIASQFWKI
jgi:hypothetical protein